MKVLYFQRSRYLTPINKTQNKKPEQHLRKRNKKKVGPPDQFKKC